MQLPRPSPRRRGDDLLPLINIIFLLLVFFMVAGTMTPPETFPVRPPDTEAGASADSETDLLVGPAGELAWRGERVSLDGLDERLGAEPPVRVVIRADAAVASRELMPVLARLRAAGVKRVTLITLRST
ncbi:hypothetical protein KBTX_02742 [wastewater metagenome]|uniref:Biopolymer transport protein ExbD/TolR n=2 Tax=unclassified sequences TaxID=12908 RepID=A0A5B8RFW9_9ZZZZ|nr:biopolymer transporter ExbD [Arhodomonas aquaeolei]QEA06404.1 hypothetical protein KBTEX_02742 [uncultured organism]